MRTPALQQDRILPNQKTPSRDDRKTRLAPSAGLPKTLPYHLMESIREFIITGEFKPGEHLREQELEQLFASSRSPIREALRLLELKGLLVHEPRRGFRVRLMSEKEIRDLYGLRAELEAYTILCMDPTSDIEHLTARLSEKNSEMLAASEAGDPRRYLAANARFHEEILAFLDNQPLQMTLAQISEIAEPLRFNALTVRFSGSSALGFHQAITEALGRRDFSRAADQMREHVLVSLPNVLTSYRDLLSEASR